MAGVQIALTPDGHPRLLLEVGNAEAQTPIQYWFAACDGGCADLGNWTVSDLLNTDVPDIKPFRTRHYFALDPQGNPRFLASTANSLTYAFCDAGCTDPTQWSGLYLAQDVETDDESLALTSAGQPRAAAYVLQRHDWTQNTLDYFECNAGCGDPNNWTTTALVPRSGGSSSFRLRLDPNDLPRLALYQDQLYYIWCNGGCADANNWANAAVGLASGPTGGDGEGLDPDLQYDALDLPHLAFRVDSARLGEGLGYAFCTSTCESVDGAWAVGAVEGAGSLDQDWPIPPRCAVGGWIAGFRPSLALDAAGNPRIAYDSEHQFNGCPDWPRSGVDGRAVRYVFFPQPMAQP